MMRYRSVYRESFGGSFLEIMYSYLWYTHISIVFQMIGHGVQGYGVG